MRFNLEEKREHAAGYFESEIHRRIVNGKRECVCEIKMQNGKFEATRWCATEIEKKEKKIGSTPKPLKPKSRLYKTVHVAVAAV